jgi:hypothetical protein
MSPVTTYPDSDVKLMFPTVYNRHTDNRSVYLATSEDGVAWQWVPGSPVVARNFPGQWAGGDVIAGQGMVQLKNNRVAILIVGYSVPHKFPRAIGEPLGTPGWAFWDRGRISSIVATEYGQFSTLGLVYEGKLLILNLLTEMAEAVKVELRDEKSKPLAGFTFTESDALAGDQPKAVASWGGTSDIGALSGKVIKVAFQLRAGRLFSFEFTH